MTEVIAERLVDAATVVATAHGLRLGDGADHAIRDFAVRAGVELATADAADVERAADAFRRLVTAMIDARGEVYGSAQLAENVVGELTLASALAKLCPLWPIC